MTKKGITASELLAQLDADSGYLKMREAQEREHAERVARFKEETAPVISALYAAGVKVQSIEDLKDCIAMYPQAVPILIEHLKRGHSEQVLEVILGTLATPYARPNWEELVEIFERNVLKLSPDVRFQAAVAVSFAADDSVLDDVLRLVNDKRLGFDRAPLLMTLSRSKSARAKMALLELKNDPDLGKEIKKMRRLARQLGRTPSDLF